MRLAPSLLALACALAAAAPARADMFTPSFLVDDGETGVCTVLNLSSKPVEVEIQIRATTGVVFDALAVTVPVQEVVLLDYAPVATTRFYCAFLGRVSAKSARAAGEVIASSITKLVVPAQ